MTVFVTEALARRFEAAELSIQDFLDEFAAWKAGWPAHEYSFELFGKDSLYEQPRVDGVRVLRHVHLMPFESNALKRWLRAHGFRGRKTSDRALVYTQKAGDFLLISILDEPDAHRIAAMSTIQERALMEAFAHVACDWLEDGSISA